MKTPPARRYPKPDRDPPPRHRKPPPPDYIRVTRPVRRSDGGSMLASVVVPMRRTVDPLDVFHPDHPR